MNGFTGHEKDFESRYMAMGVRQYDPKLGRFLSVDPLFDMFPDQTPYHYCYNSPLIYSDPSGMAPETVYEIVKEDGLTFQYVYELVRDGDIESLNPLYKKLIRKSLVGGGSVMGSGDKPIINSNEKAQGGDISGRGGGWKGTGNNSGYYTSYHNENKVQKIEPLSNQKIGNIVADAYVGNNNAYLYTIGITTTIPFVIPTIPVFLRAAIPAGLIVGGGTFFYILATAEKSKEITNPANCHATSPASPNPDFDPNDGKKKDPAKGLIKELHEHIKKLNEYTKDPLKYDNKGFLKKALEEGNIQRYNEIYQNRINILERQIQNYLRQIIKLEGK